MPSVAVQVMKVKEGFMETHIDTVSSGKMESVRCDGAGLLTVWKELF